MLAKRLEEAFAEGGNSPALVLPSATYSYSDLLGAALTVRRQIDATCPDTKLIAFTARRDFSGYGTWLGIVLSGRAYLPLSPQQPPARRDFFWKTAGQPPWWEDGKPIRSANAKGDPPAGTAYVIFTSGSTGVPKAVPVSQDNLAAYLEHTLPLYASTAGKRFSQTFDLSFDLSGHDLFIAWLSRGTLFPFTETDRLNPVDFIARHGLTHFFCVPSLVRPVRLATTERLKTLEQILFCGEPLPIRIAESWAMACPKATIDNLYGPTETTIAVSRFRFGERPSTVEELALPLGTPFPGHAFRVDGGELFVTGPQVTAGYWTAATGITPVTRQFSGDSRGWYPTGDRVRQISGEFYFAGRDDSQIKRHGYRLSLDEVEKELATITGLESARVVAVPGNGLSDPELVVFFTGAEEPPNNWFALASERLPSYMIPTYFFSLGEWPHNPNGKLDRGALVRLAQERIAGK